VRLNVGCGDVPIPGWINLDNSLSIRLAKWPAWLTRGLRAIGLVTDAQLRKVEAARTHGIVHANGTHLPFPPGSADTIYSCHMLEHLRQSEARDFLEQARRVLRQGGVLRIVVPDLRKLADEYARTHDADAFMQQMMVIAPEASGFFARLRALVAGERQHLWMYDSESLVRLVSACGFADAKAIAPGTTRAADASGLDLCERAGESIYVEAVKP